MTRARIATSRFWKGYLGAVLAAYAVLAAVLVVGLFLEEGPIGLASGLWLSVFTVPHTAVLTLVLGLIGLWVTDALKWKRWQCHLGVGAVFGGLAGVVLMFGAEPFATVLWGSTLGAMGAAAAVTYWRFNTAA